MNMIALNNTTTTQLRPKRSTIKGKASRTAKSKTEGKSAEVTLKQNETVGKPAQPKISTTPKRLVRTKNLSREDWLQVRKQGIGSSDAAASCGIHPYLSMLELWMIKTGRMTSDIDESIDGYSPLY
jgi:hypothetical protein